MPGGPPRPRHRFGARSRWPCPKAAGRCAGAARPDPRRRRIPSTGTAPARWSRRRRPSRAWRPLGRCPLGQRPLRQRGCRSARSGARLRRSRALDRRSGAKPGARGAARRGSGGGILVLGKRRRQQFQRDRLAEFEVIGAVDLAHAAAPEQCDDAVAAASTVPGTKRGVDTLAIERRRAATRQPLAAGHWLRVPARRCRGWSRGAGDPSRRGAECLDRAACWSSAWSACPGSRHGTRPGSCGAGVSGGDGAARRVTTSSARPARSRRFVVRGPPRTEDRRGSTVRDGRSFIDAKPGDHRHQPRARARVRAAVGRGRRASLRTVSGPGSRRGSRGGGCGSAVGPGPVV